LKPTFGTLFTKWAWRHCGLMGHRSQKHAQRSGKRPSAVARAIIVPLLQGSADDLRQVSREQWPDGSAFHSLPKVADA